ncbi:hypothetical protein E4U21_007068 [Claviceps maximensis]|nr:hypothetical protein E4U21_007068 [Claviceps maximensis]
MTREDGPLTARHWTTHEVDQVTGGTSDSPWVVTRYRTTRAGHGPGWAGQASDRDATPASDVKQVRSISHLLLIDTTSVARLARLPCVVSEQKRPRRGHVGSDSACTGPCHSWW